jgi:thioredoxin
MALPIVDEKNFANEVLQSQLPVLIDFFAEWCAPCKQIAPEVQAIASELQGKLKVVKVDIDRSPILARELRIQSVPTFMVFAGGRVADAQVGALRREQLRAMVEPFLPRSEGALVPKELQQLLARKMVVPVDIREEPVYKRAHLPGAVNFPEETIEQRLAELHMLTGEPVLYCRSGDKSKIVAGRLAEQGIPVAFLEGGVLAWETEGFKLDRPD